MLIKGVIVLNEKTGDRIMFKGPIHIEEAELIKEMYDAMPGFTVQFGSEITILKKPKIDMKLINKSPRTLAIVTGGKNEKSKKAC